MSRPLLYLLFVLPASVLAQMTSTEITPDTTTRKVVYDQPEKIRRFFLGFQPIYADVFSNGVNTGFGVEAFYLPKNGKFDLHASFRKPYSARFYDQARDNMDKTSNTLNESVGFMFAEVGGTWHLKDEVQMVPGKISVIRKEGNQKDRWTRATQVTVPFKQRTITGVRAGFQAWRSAVNVTEVLEKQGSRNADVALPEQLVDADGNFSPFTVFSNVYNRSVYVGYSLTRIRNHSVLFDNYETAVQDGIVMLYADVLVAPWLDLDDVEFGVGTYSLDKVKLQRIGIRAGVELKSNKKLGWGYGAELGWRPAPQGNMGYVLVRLSVPVFAGYLINRD